VIGISGYDGMERVHIIRLIHLLGGHTTDTFSKKNTHLICYKINGPKYEFARKWNIPIIKAEWLYNCIKQQQQLPVHDYLLEQPTISDGHMTVVYPSTSHTNHVDENSQYALELSFSKHLSKALELSSRLPSTTLVNEEVFLQPHESTQGSTIKDHTTEALSGGILTGAYIAISQRLAHKRTQLLELAESLGAQCLWEIDKRCTHYLHQGVRIVETFKEFKKIKQSGAKIVSPQWLYACKDHSKWLDENSFPHTLIQGMHLSLMTEKPVLSVQQETDMRFSESTSELQLSSSLLTTHSKTRSISDERQNNVGSMVDELIEQVSKDTSSLRPHKLVRRSKSIEFGDKLPETATLPMGLITAHTKKGRSFEQLHDVEDIIRYESMDFSTAISLNNGHSYDIDKQSDQELENLKEHANSLNYHQPMISKKQSSLLSPPSPPPCKITDQKRHFLLSALAESEKIHYSHRKHGPKISRNSFLYIMFSLVIKDLGASVIETNFYDTHCTHLIVGKPTRAEKYLAACAAGKW
jgi:hypothetical protein